MAVSAALLQQLLALGDEARIELATALFDPEQTRGELANALLESVDDGMTAQERAQLDAIITKSLEERRDGKGIPIKEAMAQLRARRDTRRAARQVAR